MFSTNILLSKITDFASNRLISHVILGYVLFDYVECKHCTYNYESHVKHFFCSAYEYCCGPLCCRTRSIGFFQLWYFWLMIILMLMLCSGGGWWYKFRYRGNYRQGIPNFGVTNTAPGLTPFSYGAGMQHASQQNPPPYPAGMAGAYPPNMGGAQYLPNMGGMQYPPNMGAPMYPQATNTGAAYPTMGTPYPTQPMGAMPPPPYSGPPPSYAVTMGGVNK